jgi:LmbE family N-acetylglucosaminyl deacetylase
MKLFLAPHNDDEALFGAFTLMRERPLVVVVTDSYVQWNRGDGITADQRWSETLVACEAFGCPALRLGLRDDQLTQELVRQALTRFGGFEQIYSPALQHGHPHHDLVCLAAREVFPVTRIEYCTYSQTRGSYANEGVRRIDPTPEERSRKTAALAAYVSQHARSGHHFRAVQDQPEWLTP